MPCWIKFTRHIKNFIPIHLHPTPNYNGFTGCEENSADPSEASWSGSTLFSKEDFSWFCGTRVKIFRFTHTIKLGKHQDKLKVNYATTQVKRTLRTTQVKGDWLQSLKQFFINVPYHLLVASLTMMALIKQFFINVSVISYCCS